MAEHAERRPASLSRDDPARRRSGQRHALLERRPGALSEAGYGAMLSARADGPRPIQRASVRPAFSGRPKSMPQVPVQRFIELGKPHDPSPVENDEDPKGKIRHRDGKFEAFDTETWQKGMAYRAHHYANYFGFEEDVAGHIGRWLAEGKGAELNDGPAVHAVLYTMEISKLGLENIGATTSGGSSLTLFPEGKDYIVQYFRPGAFERIKLMYDALKGAKDDVRKHVAEIHEINTSLQVAVVEKITPLNAMFDFFGSGSGLPDKVELQKFIVENASRLKATGLKAIEGLAALGVSQGDVSFDNMGVKNGEFALFDYDKARPSSEDTKEHDANSLGKSFRSRGELDMDKIQ